MHRVSTKEGEVDTTNNTQIMQLISLMDAVLLELADIDNQTTIIKFKHENRKGAAEMLQSKCRLNKDLLASVIGKYKRIGDKLYKEDVARRKGN